MDRKNLFLLLVTIFLFISDVSTASKNIFSGKNDYLPYLQIGGTRFFNIKTSSSAAIFDIFMPIWQQPVNLVFTDLRIYDRTGKPIEGNFHIGYRHLSPEKQQLYGIYSAFDRKRTNLGNYFNQITIGGEFWWNNLFLGGNFYQPIGKTSKLLSTIESADFKQVSSNIYNIWITDDEKYEQAMGGVDFETGYEFIKGLIGYAGGYYFKTKDADSIFGPKIKLIYDWFLENGKKIWGWVDKIGLEAGVQNDKPRGTTWYMSANFKISLLSNSIQNLQGVARHMVDLIRRDVDIISTETKKSKREPYKENGEIVTIGIFDKIEKLIPVLEKPEGPDIIFVNSNSDTNNIKFEISNRNQHRLSKRRQLWFGSHMDFVSKTGRTHKIEIPVAGHPISHYWEKYTHKVGVENIIDIDSLKDGLLSPKLHTQSTTETFEVNNNNKPTNKESSVTQQEQAQKPILDQKSQSQNIVGEHTIEKEPPPTLQIHPQSKSVPTSSKTIIWLINERLRWDNKSKRFYPLQY